ncbi:hypothetical protein DERF_007064 [Dermatophagoides farinae]|uniref:Uncharacterized protein n=1 Tax=Dermatophagoides farinae TaxID=6954 RepID=A0A922L2Q2_DERFA|nr:hypothetical protein DERF_007064 [Dermatophagoides farinae]
MQCIDEDDQLIYYKVGAERTKKKFKQYRITIKKRENSGETSGVDTSMKVGLCMRKVNGVNLYFYVSIFLMAIHSFFTYDQPQNTIK